MSLSLAQIDQGIDALLQNAKALIGRPCKMFETRMISGVLHV